MPQELQGKDGKQDTGKSSRAVDENITDLRRSSGDKGLMKFIRSRVGCADGKGNQRAGTQGQLFPGMSPDGKKPGDPKERIFRKVGDFPDEEFTLLNVGRELCLAPREMKHIPEGAQELPCDHQALGGRGIRVLGRKAENHRHDQKGGDKGQQSPAPSGHTAVFMIR